MRGILHKQQEVSGAGKIGIGGDTYPVVAYAYVHTYIILVCLLPSQRGVLQTQGPIGKLLVVTEKPG